MLVTETFWTTLHKGDVFLQEHNEMGLSTCDTHADGRGARYASRLRLVLNMAPKMPLLGLCLSFGGRPLPSECNDI